MRTLVEYTMAILIASIAAIGLTFVIWFICAVLPPVWTGGMPDKLRCPSCRFVSYPGDFQLVGERHQETRTDCGHGHCPCACGKDHDK